MSPTEQSATRRAARTIDADRNPNALSVELLFETHHPSRPEIAAKQGAHDRCMILDDMQRAVLDPVAQREHAAHPHPLLLRSGDLVPDPLARDLPLELGEGQQHIERQPSHARRGVERLGHRDEGDAMGIERLDQLGEVGERAGQPIDLIDDDHVDPSRLHVDEQLLERWPLHRPAGEAAVVVTIPNQPPALMRLALDVGLARLPLGVEGIEILLKPLLGRDARIDGAPQAAPDRLVLHGEASPADAPFALQALVPFLLFRRSVPTSAGVVFPWRSPKKRWPFQVVPVIALAIWDRLPKVWPFQAKPSSRIMTRSSLPFHSRTSSAPAFKPKPSRG